MSKESLEEKTVKEFGRMILSEAQQLGISVIGVINKVDEKGDNNTVELGTMDGGISEVSHMVSMNSLVTSKFATAVMSDMDKKITELNRRQHGRQG